ncbi:MAG TPA: low temperature requirement protein A [Gemmatimonadaceae bacterium]|nr:low temperature requirement protein A [Gemmatimonadaceae bacterium]
MTARVTTLELFFDLVFVFAITQVAHLVGHAHGALDILRALLVLTVVWWMYGGYAWLTNNVATDRLAHRLLLLVAMAAFLVVAVRIPLVAGRHGAAFGMAYLAIVLVHAALFTRAPNASARAILSVLPFNLVLAALIVMSGFVAPAWNWTPWAGAALAIVATTAARRERGFSVNPAHFAERHGLVVLIALGESVVAIGTGAAGQPLRPSLLTAMGFGIALAACIWWTYFDSDDTRGEQAMARASGPERATMAIRAYYYAHLVMIAGIVTSAAGMAQVIADTSRHAPPATAWLLSSGVAVYLLGGAAFRSALRIAAARARLASAALVLATGPIAARAGSLAQLATVVAILVVTLLFEHRLDVTAVRPRPAYD